MLEGQGRAGLIWDDACHQIDHEAELDEALDALPETTAAVHEITEIRAAISKLVRLADPEMDGILADDAFASLAVIERELRNVQRIINYRKLPGTQ